jgi:hypothetical protein
MDAVGRAQVIWAETKDLTVASGGDPATLMALRRHIAAIAGEAEKSFTRFEPLPAHDDPEAGRHVADCATAAESPIADEFKDLRVIVWPSSDGKTLNTDEVKPPAPWDTAKPDTLRLIGRYGVDGRDVSAFARPVAAGETTPRFVSLVTGTGLPPGTGVYVPPAVVRRPVDPAAAKAAFWLAVVMLVVFAVGCIWALSVGSASRAAYSAFVAARPDAAACPTAVDTANAAALFGAPRAWLPTATGAGDCLRAWQEATTAVLHGSAGDWWSQVKRWLAGLTVASAGQAFSLRMPMLVMMAALVLLALSAGLGVLGRPLGLFIDGRNRMSLTRIQFAVWLVVLVGALATYALFNVGFWGEELNRIREALAVLTEAAKTDQKLAGLSERLSNILEFLPKMDTALWGLIGITGGATVASSLLTQTSANPGQGGTIVPTRRVRVVANRAPKDAALADLVYGETEEDYGVVDATRVQTIAITGVLVALYANLVFEAGERIGGLSVADAVNGGTQVLASMPPAAGTFLWLLGLSHGTLLAGKLFGAYKAPATPAPAR